MVINTAKILTFCIHSVLKIQQWRILTMIRPMVHINILRLVKEAEEKLPIVADQICMWVKMASQLTHHVLKKRSDHSVLLDIKVLDLLDLKIVLIKVVMACVLELRMDSMDSMATSIINQDLIRWKLLMNKISSILKKIRMNNRYMVIMMVKIWIQICNCRPKMLAWTTTMAKWKMMMKINNLNNKIEF